MAFSHEIDKKGLSLPGMIDIVFLLLIFSLVTLAVSQSPVEDVDTDDDISIQINLPTAKARSTVETGTVLRTLCFQIEYLFPDSVGSPRIAYALWPGVKDSITIEEARINARKDSLKMAFIPENFLLMNEQDFNQTAFSSMIRRNISNYKDEYFREPKQDNAIDIRAERNTEFRLINYILEYAGSFGDTIPRFLVRTVSSREAVDGV